MVEEAIAANRTSVEPECLARLTRRIRSAAQITANTTHGRRDKLEAKRHALARRILDRQADYLRFATDFRVPVDNNAAEREIRMI